MIERALINGFLLKNYVAIAAMVLLIVGMSIAGMMSNVPLFVIQMIIFHIGAIGILMGAVFTIRVRLDLRKNGHQTDGIIIGMKRKWLFGGYVPPTVEYKINNETHRFDNDVYEKSYLPYFTEHKPIRIIYDPQNPKDAFINTPYSLWLKPLVMLYIVVMTLAIDFYLFS